MKPELFIFPLFFGIVIGWFWQPSYVQNQVKERGVAEYVKDTSRYEIKTVVLNGVTDTIAVRK